MFEVVYYTIIVCPLVSFDLVQMRCFAYRCLLLSEFLVIL